jgi:GNAT superfamily N-acetyltransferase
MNIRLATLDDSTAINALYSYLNPNVLRESTLQSIRDAINAVHVYIIVMEDEDIMCEDTGHIIGSGCFNEIIQPSVFQKKAFVDDFVLHPAARGKGYGKKLYSALEEEARRRGFSRLIYTVGVGEHRTAMRKLHAKMGHRVRAHAVKRDDTNFYDHELM